MSEKSKPATETDLESGRAVFCVSDNRSRVYELGIQLPALAKTIEDMSTGTEHSILPAGTVITVIQVEIVDEKDILVGFRVRNESGVCMLNQIELKPDG